MGPFDQTGRQMAKVDGAALLGWALSGLKGPRLVFLGWDDTRRLVVPGEPDRVNDLVAQVRDLARPRRATWLIAEIEGEAEPGIFWRTGQYEVLLGKELNPSCDPDGPAAIPLVLNLSGRQPAAGLRWAWGRWGTRLAPLVVDVAAQDAAATLGRIERGEVGLTVLPFLALMEGGGDPAFIARWKRAAEGEPDESRRLLYRDSALVMADLTRRQINWHQALEGWMERESAYINSFIKRGRDDGELRKARSFLLKALGRLQNPVPESVRLAVEGTNDVATLDRWFRVAVRAENLSDVRREMNLEA
ncbi:MAG: hypothetical protein ACRC33_00745 [Gemmataceae bacterium]